MWNSSIEIWLLGLLAAYTFLSASGLDPSDIFNNDDDDDDDNNSGSNNNQGDTSSNTPRDERSEQMAALAADPRSANQSDFDVEETLTGGSGNDTLAGSNEEFQGAGVGVLVNGLAGEDSLSGSNSNDSIFGGDGDDSILSRLRDDVVFGGRGDDVINAGWQNDVAFGDSGDDTVYGLYGNDTLFGGAGDDFLSGGGLDSPLLTTRDGVSDGEETLFGGAGNDTLLVGSNDLAHGGSGEDLFVLDASLLSADAPAYIFDYNAADDRISVDVSELEGDQNVFSQRLDDPTQIGIFAGGELRAVLVDQAVDSDMPVLVPPEDSEQ